MKTRVVANSEQFNLVSRASITLVQRNGRERLLKTALCNSHALRLRVGETSRHILTPIREHLRRDRTSYIFQHLQNAEECRRLCSESCFSVFDTAPNRFQLLLKEAAHIRWGNPSLNRQLKHAELTLSLSYIYVSFL